MTSSGGGSFSAGVSPLDEAFGKRAAGDPEGALRLAVAILDAGAKPQPGAALLGSWLLAEANQPLLAGEVASRLVDAYLRRGDLAAAVVAAHVAGLAGEDGAALRGQIAQVFGAGSPRLGDVSPAPPPLPGEVAVAPWLARLSGPALFERAESALQSFLGEDDPVPADAPVPELPLFSSLPPAALEILLGSLEVRDAGQGDVVIRQGDEGREAFVLVRGALEVARGEDAQRTTLAALGPGAIFGEMALVSDAPRAASVVAVEPALLLAVSRSSLEDLASQEPAIGGELGRFCRGRMVSNLIRHSPILGAVDPAEREELIDRFEAQTFDKGDALVRSGEQTDALFLIASGGVAVMGQDAEGDRIRLAELGPGDVVGEISLVLRRPANADVVAAHPTVALRLGREEFQQAIRAHPGLLHELYEIATKREEETRSVVAQEAIDLDDAVLV